MDHAILEYNLTLRTVCIARLRKTGDAAGHKIGIWKRYVTRGCGTCMTVFVGQEIVNFHHPMVFTLFVTVFVGQEIVNFPAPQKLDPKISPHGMTVFVGQEMVNFPAPQKLDPKPQNRAKTVVFSMFMQNPKQQT